MSRLSFRPRPVDIHKKLPIVRSVEDLDTEDGGVSRALHHNHFALDAENEKVLPAPTRKGGSEIPTPHFEVVESYLSDYTPTFNQPQSYLRSKAARSESEDFVDYDLDDEDEDWLNTFNSERKILTPEKFEYLLYRLEIMDSKQRDRAALGPFVLGNPVPVLLSWEAALEALKLHLERQTVLHAVYDYWKAKRDRWQKPILRRLQPSPSVNDTNPFNVFRPREKIHRPHTRRMQKKENDVQSFDKLRQVWKNIQEAKLLLLGLQQREHKKRELAECEMYLQRLQIKLRHDGQVDLADLGPLSLTTSMPPPMPRKPLSSRRLEAAEVGSSAAFHGRAPGANGVIPPGPDFRRVRAAQERDPPFTEADVRGSYADVASVGRRKRRRNVGLGRGGAFRPPKRVVSLELDPVFLFNLPIDADKLSAAGISEPHQTYCENGVAASMRCSGRIGRGGRLIFDRWNALGRAPLGLGESLEPPDRKRAPPLPGREERWAHH